MGNPVVHFEVIGRNAPNQQRFFANLFDWKIDANNPFNYGLVDTGAGRGINGGIGGGEGNEVTFFVEVDDLQAYLDRAVDLGGRVHMAPSDMGGGLSIASFFDPEGNRIGLVKPAPRPRSESGEASSGFELDQ